MVGRQEDTPNVVEVDTATSVGAVEEPADRPAENVDELTENISEGHEEELTVGGDFNEGQTQGDYEDAPDDEPRQST